MNKGLKKGLKITGVTVGGYLGIHACLCLFYVLKEQK